MARLGCFNEAKYERILSRLEGMGAANALVFETQACDAKHHSAEGLPWLGGAWDSFQLKVKNKYGVSAHVSSCYMDKDLRLTGLVVSPVLVAELKRAKNATQTALAQMATNSWLDPKLEVSLVGGSDELKLALSRISREVWCTTENCVCNFRSVRWSSMSLT